MIRYAKEKDLDSIFNLMCDLEYTKLDYERFKKIYNFQLNNPLYHLLVYERDNKVIAFINSRIEGQLHHSANIAEIIEFGVASEYRSSGIGKLLIDEIYDIAKEENCQIIEVACNKMRQRARRFYEREKFLDTHYKFTYEL